MSKSVNPKFVNVSGKTYKIVTVSSAQKWGQADFDNGADYLTTFKGERVAVLKPV